MNPSQLKNNDELYRYLVWLAAELKERGKSEASNQVTLASQFAFGSPSEFLHETMIVLAFVQAKCNDVLADNQRTDLESVIEQIKTAFQRVGGA